MNRYSIGIEMDNTGILTPSGDSFVSWFGRKYASEEVMKAIHRNEAFEKYWHIYTEKQIASAFDLCEALMKAYPVKHILGHEEVSPGRKTDPGPAFPLDKLRQRLLEKERSEEEAAPLPQNATVAVERLNFRAGPSADSEKVCKPLKRGARLKVLEKQGAWYKVSVEQEGWVMGSYIEKQ
jgi:N-acetylmuramoyl-L-alanine amidase